MNKIYELRKQQHEVLRKLYTFERYFMVGKDGFIPFCRFDDPEWVSLISEYNLLAASIQTANKTLNEINTRLHGAWILRSLNLDVNDSFDLRLDFEAIEADFSNPYILKAMLENASRQIFDETWPDKELLKIVIRRHDNHVRFYLATAPNDRNRRTQSHYSTRGTGMGNWVHSGPGGLPDQGGI